jgi:hypothetical protein
MLGLACFGILNNLSRYCTTFVLKLKSVVIREILWNVKMFRLRKRAEAELQAVPTGVLKPVGIQQSDHFYNSIKSP